MNKKTVVSVMAVAMLFAVSLFFVGGTYARYTGTFEGKTQADIAKWAIKVGGQESETFTPSFTYVENQYVADNKLAPNRSMTADIDIDLTGTEVAVDVLAKIDLSQLTAKIGDSQITATATIGGQDATSGDGLLIELPEKAAFTSENGKKTLKITITWDNQEDAQNASDTNIGKTIENLQIPVTLTVQQHIVSE